MSIVPLQLQGCYIKAIKADLKTGRATVTLDTYLDDQLLDNRLKLSCLANDQAPVDVTLSEQQMTLPFKSDSQAA